MAKENGAAAEVQFASSVSLLFFLCLFPGLG